MFFGPLLTDLICRKGGGGDRVLVKILAPTINKILSAIPFQIMEDLNWETILMGVFLTFTFAQHILITVHADCKL